MKRNIFFFLLFNVLFTVIIHSQNKEKFDYELLGILMLEKTQLYSYKIEFNLNKDSVHGYSYTDLTGPDETKSFIYGTYDKKTNIFEFEERDVLYTKSRVVTNEFCFIKAKGKLQFNSKKQSFDSNFEGLYESGELCAEGRIKIVGTNYIQNKIKKVYRKIKNKKRIDSVTKEQLKPEKVLKRFGKTSLTEDEILTVYLKSKKMKIEIWDYGKEDGDIIDFYLNGKKLLNNLKLKKKKKRMILNLENGKNSLKISTINGGFLETNTAIIKIFDNSRFYELKSDIKEGKSATINIIVYE